MQHINLNYLKQSENKVAKNRTKPYRMCYIETRVQDWEAVLQSFPKAAQPKSWVWFFWRSWDKRFTTETQSGVAATRSMPVTLSERPVLPRVEGPLYSLEAFSVVLGVFRLGRPLDQKRAVLVQHDKPSSSASGSQRECRGLVAARSRRVLRAPW